jgi:hypothetical protein
LSGNFAEMTTSTPSRDLLLAANLRHGTDGFTSPLKEGVLRIFSPLKIRWLRPVFFLNLRLLLNVTDFHCYRRFVSPILGVTVLCSQPSCSIVSPSVSVSSARAGGKVAGPVAAIPSRGLRGSCR